MKKIIILSLFFCAGCASITPAQDEKTIASPDGHVRFSLSAADGKLTYEVTFNGRPVVATSPMAISVDKVSLTDHAEIGKTESYKVDKTYPWYGGHSTAVNRCNGEKIALKAGNGTDYTLEVRAFNDAVAFRWIIPGEEDTRRIPDEATAFTLPEGSTVWYHDLRMHYEGVHVRKEITNVQDSEWAAPPLTFRLPRQEGYASITEANLLGYSGMALQANGKNGFVLRLAQHQPVSYPYELRYSKEDVERSLQPASVTGIITTPWRVVMIGADLNALVNCDAVPDLCAPPDPKLFPQGIHTDWVKPGRAVWKYLDGGGASTIENMKHFSEMAGELGFEYNILEGFWSRWSDEEIKDLVDYSRQQGVGIWVWKHSKQLRDPQERHQFFQRCHDLGITGVKIDFFDSEAKSVIDLYEAILNETAALHLLVDFHGADKPTGLARTWPNELGREAVKGMESRSIKDRATHTTTLPFTRYLAGPADYTPVIFADRRGNTTWANQVASAVILGAPLLTYGANPANILSNPSVDMIKSIPSIWDETIVLPPSAIGEIAVFARRKGDTWFLVVMNGAKPQTIKVPLSFLGKGNYQAALVRDGETPASVDIENGTHKRGDTLQIQLGEGGGFIGRFSITH